MDKSVFLLVGIIIVIITVMMWNNKHEGLFLYDESPNQVYQGYYTNSLTNNPRVWSCPSGSSGVGCHPNSTEGYSSSGQASGYGGASSEELYKFSGMEPASDLEPINIIQPPFTDQAFRLQFGMGPGLLGSGRATSSMVGN